MTPVLLFSLWAITSFILLISSLLYYKVTGRWPFEDSYPSDCYGIVIFSVIAPWAFIPVFIIGICGNKALDWLAKKIKARLSKEKTYSEEDVQKILAEVQEELTRLKAEKEKK